MHEVEWKPRNWEVKRSKHTIVIALKAVHAFATNFNEWKVLANNCSSWAIGVVGFMSDDKKREKYECEPITDDFDKLSTFGASIGVELMYLSSTEAAEPIPSQEEGEEETFEDQEEHRSDGPIVQENMEEGGMELAAVEGLDMERGNMSNGETTVFQAGKDESTRDDDGNTENIEDLNNKT